MTQEEKFKEAKRLYETANADQKYVLESLFPELVESEDERIRKQLIVLAKGSLAHTDEEINEMLTWLEAQGKQKPTLPKWKYKKDHAPLLRDSIILNKYGCVAKSPSGALVSDVWVIDYDELAKLPKEEIKKQDEQKSYASETMNEKWDFDSGFTRMMENEQKSAWSEEDESMLQNILECLKNGWRKLPTDILKYESWLKSLKDRYTWKPSELQLECLDDAIKDYQAKGFRPVILMELLEELKKL